MIDSSDRHIARLLLNNAIAYSGAAEESLLEWIYSHLRDLLDYADEGVSAALPPTDYEAVTNNKQKG